MAQAVHSIVGREFAAADLVEEFADGFGFHGRTRHSALRFSRARPRLASLGVRAARSGADSGNHGGTDLAGQARLVQMSEKQSAQAALLHFTRKVDVVDLTSQAVPPIPRDRFKLLLIGADGRLCSFFNGRA